MRPVHILTLAVAAVAFAANPGQADTLTFGNTSDTADTYISSGTKYSNFGGNNFVDVGPNSNPTVAGLLGFPTLFGSGPGQIPLGSTITSATLSLYVASTAPYPNVSFNLSNVAWDENTVTYKNFGGDSGIQSNEKGALVGYIAGSNLHQGAGNNVDITAALQAWSNGTPNFGLILTATPNCQTISFGSSEYDCKDGQPKLTVTYTPPGGGGGDGGGGNPVPEPASMALLGIGGLFAARLFRRKNDSGSSIVA